MFASPENTRSDFPAFQEFIIAGSKANARKQTIQCNVRRLLARRVLVFIVNKSLYQLRKGESNVQLLYSSQAADREIEVIPKNVFPGLQLLCLGHSMDHHKGKQKQLTNS